MRIRPLRPLIPSSNYDACALVCPPYDTLSTDEARAYLKSHPNSFMSVIRPDTTLPSNIPPYHSTVYTSAATALDAVKQSGRLVRAPACTFYVYQQRMHHHVQRGLDADGHHRAASAARVARERGQREGGRSSDSDWFLSVLFPYTQLKILAYNRLVKDLNCMDSESFLARLSAVGTLRPIEAPSSVPTTRGNVYVFVSHDWYELKLKPIQGSTEKGMTHTLDASLLQQRILQPILGIADPTQSTRIEFVGGIRGVRYLEDQACKGAGDIAFALCPVTVQQLMHVADSGEIMPPKSTWFEPKLLSGFFVHTF